MSKEKKIKILLIEDDNFLVEMYTTKFELEGFEIASAEDGQKGLEMVKREKPDIILLDIFTKYNYAFIIIYRIILAGFQQVIPAACQRHRGNGITRHKNKKCVIIVCRVSVIKIYFFRSRLNRIGPECKLIIFPPHITYITDNGVVPLHLCIAGKPLSLRSTFRLAPYKHTV